MANRGKSLITSLTAAALLALVLSASASACSCAGRPGKDAFRSSDAVVIAKLVRVEPVGDFLADYVLRVRESFKRTHRFEPGQTRTIRSANNGAACGLEQPVGSVAGLYLYRQRGGLLASNLCLTTTPARIRHTAEVVTGPEKLTSVSAHGGCSASA